jgi:Pyruvate/2-oxoacid:ferredoxin oxidoreductase delta subunit
MAFSAAGTGVGGTAERPRLVAVVGDDCTGCYACVDYCLVDCIEPSSPQAGRTPSVPIAVREDECIGCFVCAKICDALDVNAIRLVPASPAG